MSFTKRMYGNPIDIRHVVTLAEFEKVFVGSKKVRIEKVFIGKTLRV